MQLLQRFEAPRRIDPGVEVAKPPMPELSPMTTTFLPASRISDRSD